MTHDPRDRSRQSKRPGRAGRDLPPGAEIPLIHGEIPPREVLLRFIADHPDKASKREISKEFGLKGEKRVELKQILKSFEEEGLLEKRRKSLVRPGALPPVTVLDITTRDVTGDLIGRPAEWLDDLGVAPAVTIRQPSVGKSAGKAPVAGAGFCWCWAANCNSPSSSLASSTAARGKRVGHMSWPGVVRGSWPRGKVAAPSYSVGMERCVYPPSRPSRPAYFSRTYPTRSRSCVRCMMMTRAAVAGSLRRVDMVSPHHVLVDSRT